MGHFHAHILQLKTCIKSEKVDLTFDLEFRVDEGLQ